MESATTELNASFRLQALLSATVALATGCKSSDASSASTGADAGDQIASGVRDDLTKFVCKKTLPGALTRSVSFTLTYVV